MSEQQDEADLVESTRELGRDVEKVGRDIQHIYRKAQRKVNFGKIYQDNPWAVLGAAAGIGYVLGGGLFTPLTWRLLKMGARTMLVPMATEQLAEMLPEEDGEK